MSGRLTRVAVRVVTVATMVLVVACGVRAHQIGLAEDTYVNRTRDMQSFGLLSSEPELRLSTPTDVQSLLARIDDLGKWVGETTREDELMGLAELWPLEEREQLGAELRDWTHVLEEVDSILAEPMCRATDGGTLHLTREALGPPTRLRSARQLNMLLASHAVWLSGEDGSRAIHRLGQCMDLMRVVDDGSAISYLCQTASEPVVLSALRTLVQSPLVDAAGLRDVMDTRLRVAAHTQRLASALRHEVELGLDPDLFPLEARDGLVWTLQRGHAIERANQTLDVYLELMGLSKGACTTAGGVRRDAVGRVAIDPLPCAWPGDQLRGLKASESVAHTSRRRLVLARVALALHAQRRIAGAFPDSLEGLTAPFRRGIPADPCTREPFEYEKTTDGVRLSCSDLAHLGPPHVLRTDERQLVWVLSR